MNGHGFIVPTSHAHRRTTLPRARRCHSSRSPGTATAWFGSCEAESSEVANKHAAAQLAGPFRPSVVEKGLRQAVSPQSLHAGVLTGRRDVSARDEQGRDGL